jgi:electron transfer flavoprotein alpha subunit
MKPRPLPGNTGETIAVDAHEEDSDSRIHLEKIIPHIKHSVSLEKADVIVAGGRGLGAPKQFDLLHELAELLSGQVGASRAAVDMGWIGHDHQVGQTGKTVRPRLYIACGISGAVQHVAGMQNAEMIVAINSDPHAPIFEFAHMAIVGNFSEVIPELISRLKSRPKPAQPA